MRFVPSLEKSGPLKEVVTNGAAVTAKHLRDGEKVGEKGVVEEGGTEQSEREEEVAGQVTRNGRQRSEPPSNRKEVDVNQDEDSVQNPMGDDEMEEFLSGIDKTIQNAAPLSGSPPKAATSRETEKVVESIEPVQPKTLPPQKSTSPRNNGRKRKSEEFEQDGPAAAPSSKKPAKKPRAPNKTEGPKAKSSKQKAAATPLFNQDFAPQPPSTGAQEPPPQSTSAAPNMRTLTTSDANAHLSLSHRQRAELDQIIEKVRSRPGKLKTLYVLKREKAKKASTGDDVRAGRAVVKPLAYWNAESCVHDDGDGAPALEVGARIPLGNVREVGAPPQQQKGDTSMEDDAGFGFGCDGHEEPWETDIGVFRGQANVWNPDPSNDEQEEMTEETDLAFHPSSMLTREVKGSGGFRFAKLVSTPFFGCGIVDLPPGGVKRPKNSRAMHMCFFVAKGRVTVRVGREIDPDVDVDGEGETFSIGRGGVFQVPRGELRNLNLLSCYYVVDLYLGGYVLTRDLGNKYSIENVLDKPARIFFSQGCETVPEA